MTGRLIRMMFHSRTEPLLRVKWLKRQMNLPVGVHVYDLSGEQS